MRLVFYDYLGAAEKKKQQQNKTKQKNKRSLSQYFPRMAEKCAFWQRNRRRSWAWLFSQRS